MSFKHKELAAGRWRKLSLMGQMANIGSEVTRALNWKGRDKKTSEAALFRAVELIDLTLQDPKNKKRLFEISRVREFLLNYFLGQNSYGYTDQAWKKYFYGFAYANALALDKQR